jgi:hypothetical protein
MPADARQPVYFATRIVRHKTTAAMAKRKSKADPEELPDAADKGKKQDDDSSGSDEVCDSRMHPRHATHAHRK